MGLLVVEGFFAVEGVPLILVVEGVIEVLASSSSSSPARRRKLRDLALLMAVGGGGARIGFRLVFAGVILCLNRDREHAHS